MTQKCNVSSIQTRSYSDSCICTELTLMYRFHVVSLKILSTGSFAPRNKSQEFSVVISVKFSICYVGAGTYEIQSDGIDVDIS